MNLRICLFATALIVLAAADYFSEPYACLQDVELPRTVENISGEWFFRKLHATNVDPQIDDEWTDDFPTEEHGIFFTLRFDEGGFGCIKLKHEGPRIVHAWFYCWSLSDDTLILSNDWEDEAYRIETLTYSQLVLVIRRVNLQGETYESTYYYERYVR